MKVAGLLPSALSWGPFFRCQSPLNSLVLYHAHPCRYQFTLRVRVDCAQIESRRPLFYACFSLFFFLFFSFHLHLLIATFLDSYVGISQNSSKTPNLLMTLDFIGFSKVHDLKSKDIYKLNRGQSQIPRHSPCIFARKRLFAA